MAAETRASPGHSRLLTVALAFLGGVTGVAFGRVFLGTHPAVRLAAAGVVAVLIAAALARRPLALSLLASAAGLMVALGLLVFPRTTWAGLPGPETLEAIIRALGRVTDRAAAEIAPAPPLASLMTAGVIAVWSASTAAHALAVRSASSLLPLLPGAALLGFTGVVTEEPPRPGYVLLFLAAAFAVLFGEAVQRTAAWTSPRERTLFSGRWARVMGATAALASISVPGLLPGFGDAALIELDKPDSGIGVSPIVDIRPSLLQNPVADLFWVTAERPSYWRMVVLDRFDGRLWTPSETQEAGHHPLDAGFTQFAKAPAPRERFLEQQIEIGQLAVPWLPAASDPIAVELEDDLGATQDQRTGELELAAETTEGLRYMVTSAQSWPSIRSLKDQTPNNPLGDPRYTALPTGLPDRIRQIALDVAGRASSPLEAILAIQSYLRTFRYDDRAPAGHGVDDMLHFLEQSRRGYCEQFAGAMAVLVRSLGYPARVAIGFQPGERDESGRFRVTTAQIHAWPEVHFGDYGWLAFEPTPGRNNPSAAYLLPPSLRGRGAGSGGGGAGEGGPSATGVELRESFRPPTGALRPLPGARRTQEPEPFPWGRLIAVALALAAAMLLVAPPARAIGRRAAFSRARDDRGRVLAAYDWLLDGAAGLGLGRRSQETPLEYGGRLAEHAPADSLDRITSLAHLALYSRGAPRAEDGDRAIAAVREVLRDLRRQAGPLRTLLGTIRPGPRPA